MNAEVNRLVSEIRSRQLRISTLDNEILELEGEYANLGDAIDRKEADRNEIQAELDELTQDLIAAAKGVYED